MNWLKRNLFFAVGVAVAVALMVVAFFYIFKSMAANDAAYAHLTEIYTSLRAAADYKPSPGDEHINNTQAANEQAKQLHQWIRRARIYFQPIAPIPSPTNGPLTDASFGYAMHNAITLLQHEAENANVTLPPQYNFSFQAQSDKVRFAPPGIVDKLSVQLGEVKSISEIIFGAHVNALEGVQRLRVSDDDAQGQATDYIDGQPVTTDLATLTPYQVTFDGFSAEIAEVLSAFASSPNGFVIKTINVQPAGNGPTETTAAPMPGRGGMQTILSEQMLRVTLLVEVVKLSPGN